MCSSVQFKRTLRVTAEGIAVLGGTKGMSWCPGGRQAHHQVTANEGSGAGAGQVLQRRVRRGTEALGGRGHHRLTSQDGVRLSEERPADQVAGGGAEPEGPDSAGSSQLLWVVAGEERLFGASFAPQTARKELPDGSSKTTDQGEPVADCDRSVGSWQG